MKQGTVWYGMAVLLLLVAGACAPITAGESTSEAVEALPTEEPTAVKAGWSEVARSKIMEAMGQLYYAGFDDASHGFAVGYAGLVRRTEDGGKTWEAGTNNSWCLFGLEIVDTLTAITCGNNQHLRRTVDGGQFWSPMHEWGAMEPDQCRYLSFVDANTGWAARPQAMAATTDGGITWTDLPLETVLKGTEFTPVIAAISRITVDAGFLLTNEGLLYKTTDGGKVWSMVSALAGTTVGINPHHGLTPEMAPAVALRFTDAQNGMLAIRRTGAGDFVDGLEFSIMVGRTANGGLTWEIEELSDWKGKLGVFLSRDGKYLTLTDTIMAEVIVLQYN